MTQVTPPHNMPTEWVQAPPLLNDNFEKVGQALEMYGPRTFSTQNTAGRIAAGGQLSVFGIFLDRPEYNDFATLTQELDIYVDSGTNATGTVSITNNSGATINIAVGDYFNVAVDFSLTSARVFIATSAVSILTGTSNSVTVVAEQCGSNYNLTAETVNWNAVTVYHPYEINNLTMVSRFVSITPWVAGSGGGGITMTVTSTGGGGSPNTAANRWPNGSSLTSAQKDLVVTEELLITPTLPTLWTATSTAPYTKQFALTTVNIRNNDASQHSIYVYLSGKVFSGKPTYTINR